MTSSGWLLRSAWHKMSAPSTPGYRQARREGTPTAWSRSASRAVQEETRHVRPRSGRRRRCRCRSRRRYRAARSPGIRRALKPRNPRLGLPGVCRELLTFNRRQVGGDPRTGRVRADALQNLNGLGLGLS